jgi:hypothetical protein
MISGTGFCQTSDGEKINPDVSGSKGGSRSERTGDVPLPKGSPYAGTVEKGQSGPTDVGASKKTDSTSMKKSDSDTTKGNDTDQPNQTPEK